MAGELCWFGYVRQLHALRIAVELDLNRGVNPLFDSVEGLDAIRDREYPLILFNVPTPVGTLALPEGVCLRDFTSTDRYVIQRARNIRPHTPLIVTHSSYFDGHDLTETLKQYKEAGATDFIDVTRIISGKEFTEFLERHL